MIVSHGLEDNKALGVYNESFVFKYLLNYNSLESDSVASTQRPVVKHDDAGKPQGDEKNNRDLEEEEDLGKVSSGGDESSPSAHRQGTLRVSPCILSACLPGSFQCVSCVMVEMIGHQLYFTFAPPFSSDCRKFGCYFC